MRTLLHLFGLWIYCAFIPIEALFDAKFNGKRFNYNERVKDEANRIKIGSMSKGMEDDYDRYLEEKDISSGLISNYGVVK